MGFEPMTSEIPVRCSSIIYHIHVFIRSSHIWFSYSHSHLFITSRVVWNQHNDQLPIGMLNQNKKKKHLKSVTSVITGNHPSLPSELKRGIMWTLFSNAAREFQMPSFQNGKAISVSNLLLEGDKSSCKSNSENSVSRYHTRFPEVDI